MTNRPQPGIGKTQGAQRFERGEVMREPVR